MEKAAPRAPAPDAQQSQAERYREAGARLQSFRNWPYARSHFPLCTPDRLAGCGFYHDPDAEFEDRVSCAFCHLSLGGWDRSHDPVKEHQKISPRCPFLVQFGLPTSFVTAEAAKTELVGATWIVENHVDDEVQVRADGAHQDAVVRSCCSRNARMVCVVQGPVGNVTIEECAKMRLSILGSVQSVTIKMCEEVEITVQEGKPPPMFVIDKTNGCRLELNPGAVGGNIITMRSCAILIVHSLGVTVVKPPVAPGAKVPEEYVITSFVDGNFVQKDVDQAEALQACAGQGGGYTATSTAGKIVKSGAYVYEDPASH